MITTNPGHPSPSKQTFGQLFLKTVFALLLFFTTNTLQAQKIEDTTCYAYFRMTDHLRQGDSLDRKTWFAFLQNKSIQVYAADQGFDSAYFEGYRKTMQVVYMPKYDSILRRRLQDSMTYWLTYLVYQYKKNEDAMKVYLKQVTEHQQAYFDTCYKYCYGALPARAQKKAPEEVFSIIPLHNDAHAESGWVIYSLLCAYFNDTNKPGVLGGHELHHVLRPQMEIKADKEDAGIVQLFQRTLNEGSADLIDKKYMTHDAKALLFYQQETFPDFYNQAALIMPRIDSLLQVASRGNTAFTFWNLIKGAETGSGHVPGTYMSYFIEKNGLKKELLQHIEDPFYFYLLYNKAAQKDKGDAYVFSATTIGFIKKLQKKYH